MTNIVESRNIASLISPVAAIAPNTVTAPTASQQTGVKIDRFNQNQGALAMSMVSHLNIKAVLAAKKKLTVARKLETGASTSSYATFGTAPTNTVIGSTSATAAQTISTVINDAYDLTAALRYIHIDVTPTFSATSLDTMALAATAVLGGFDKVS